MLNNDKQRIKKELFSMSIITSEVHFRRRVLKYSLKHGVTAASNRFQRCRQAIYEWKARYDNVQP